MAMPSGPAMACRCAPLGEGDAFAAADVVFEGVVADVVEPDLDALGAALPGDQIRYRFLVDRPMKGPVELGQVDVFTSWSLRGCGIEMTAGERWVVFALAVNATTLTTTGCAGNRLADEHVVAVPAPSEATGPPAAVLLGAASLAILLVVSALAFIPRARRD
jgi:hypothetical protein